jgi:glycosyltransferase involved in cell wall biosynthesis
MDKILCSIPILTLNSGATIARCLDSVTAFDDVFLVDGNSTDDTLQIAQERGIPVYPQVQTSALDVKITNFSDMRIRAESFSRHDWVFVLDSDEHISLHLAEKIREKIDLACDSRPAMYCIAKKYCIGQRTFEHAFNYPNYCPRLYSILSGVGWVEGKVVHEQLNIPDSVERLAIDEWFYSEVPATYRAGVQKDRHQLSLMKKSTFSQVSFKNRSHSMRISLKYGLRAGKILIRSLWVYLRFGYSTSLPFGHVWRHIRVHFFMAYWRLVQFFWGHKAWERYGKTGQ